MFLSTPVHHIWVVKKTEPWLDNQTKNTLETKKDTDEQKWFICPQGAIKHLKDGRVLSSPKRELGQEIDTNVGLIGFESNDSK